MRTFRSSMLAIILMACHIHALAANRIEIESATVVPSGNITVGVYLENDVAVSAVTVPLTIRELTPGSFMTSLNALDVVPGSRLETVLTDQRFNQSYPSEDGLCKGGQPGGFGTIAPPDFISPDGLLISRLRIVGADLPPGTDFGGTPSFQLTMEVTGTEGTFEIDSTCADPGNHLLLLDAATLPILPAFTKGIITIAEPFDPWANSIVVESKYVLPGETGVTIPIRITNDEELAQLSVPLTIREITPGSFITSLGLVYADRLALGGPLSQRFVFQMADPDGSCKPGGYGTITYDDGGPNPVVASPEGAVFFCYGVDIGDTLAPGSDATGSLVLMVDVTSVPGSFEIDTTCADPNSHLKMWDVYFNPIVPSFAKGTIVIAPPCEGPWTRLLRKDMFSASFNTDVELDGQGNVCVRGGTSGAGSSVVTAKYDSDGDTLWVRCFESAWDNSSHGGELLRIDAADNVYVAGTTRNSTDDFATVKYSADGDELWYREYNSPGDLSDVPRSIDVDASGNVYVTGHSSDFASHWTTVKYDSYGNQLWARHYDPIGGDGYDAPSALKTDRDGNVYVTGVGYLSSDDQDFVTLKYAPNGDLLWHRQYTYLDQPDTRDRANALDVDDDGNVYVTGFGNSAIPDESDYVTLKYAPDGTLLWARIHEDGSEAEAVCVDGSGNVYVTGGGYAGGPEWQCVTVKYSADGDIRWTRQYEGSAALGDGGTSLGVDDVGNVYVTGSSVGVGTGVDCFTLMYDSDGNLAEEWRYNGPGNSQDVGYDLAIDESGGVYVAGHATRVSVIDEALTIKYCPGSGPGDEQSLLHHCGPCDCPYQADYDADGFLTALDLGNMIDVLFTGKPDIQDPTCLSTTREDFDADGFATALDLGKLIDHLFAGQPGPCDPCDPVQSTCAK